MKHASADPIPSAVNRHRIAAWAGAAAAVVLPVVAWYRFEPFDLHAGHAVMLVLATALAGLAYEIAVRVPGHRTRLVGVALALAGIVLILWANGAVGIIRSEDDPVNRIFLVPVGIAFAGVLAAGVRASLAANLLVLAAVAQAGTFVYALAGGHGFIGPVTVLFCAVWLAASVLLRRAARQDPAPSAVTAS